MKRRDIVAELGYENESTRGDAPSTNASYPQGFIRYGVLDNVELDYIGPAYGITSGGGAREHGAFDSGVGAKYEFFHDESNVAGSDILYTVPTGSPGFSNGGASETLNLDASHNVSSTFSVSGTIGLTSTPGTRLNGTNARYAAWLPSLAATEQFGARAQVYLEASDATRIRPDGGSQFALDGGLQYLLSPQIEVDVETGRTVTDIARSRFIGFGFALRF